MSIFLKQDAGNEAAVTNVDAHLLCACLSEERGAGSMVGSVSNELDSCGIEVPV